MLRHLWPTLAVLTMLASVAAALDLQSRQLRTSLLHERERPLGKTLTRDSRFSEVPHLNARSSCEAVQPPEALTTPEPLLTPARERMRVKISFIIGTDGRVHAPLILESAGPARDRRILQTVRTWRYRPATCNGVPTETEGKVEFSSR